MTLLKYQYNNTLYFTPMSVHRAIWEKERKVCTAITQDQFDKQGFAVEVIEFNPVDMLPDDIQKGYQLQQLKKQRSEQVSKIVVEVDGMKFDGDETAQTRMGRTIAAAIAQGVDIDKEMRTWVLADNSIVQVSIKQLAQALEKAGNEQTSLWTIPYTESETGDQEDTDTKSE